MAINRIGNVAQTTSLPTADDSQVGSSRRISLHTETTFERGSDSDFDPSQFQSNAVTDEQRKGAQVRFDSLSADDKVAVTDAVTKIRSVMAGMQAGSLSAADGADAFRGAMSTYSSALTSATGLSSSAAAQHSMNDILAVTVNQVEGEVGELAVELQGKLDIKANIREQSTELGDMIANWPEGENTTQTYTWTSYDINTETNEVTATTHTEELTKEEAIALKDGMSSELETMNEMTQTLQLDLQQKYQDQNMALSTMSEIMKAMHETMKNTIMNSKAS